MSQSPVSCKLDDVAKACLTTRGKLQLLLVKEGLHDESVEGRGSHATLTSAAALKKIIAYYREHGENETADGVDFEWLEDQLPAGQDMKVEASGISLIGIGRTSEKAVARAEPSGYAFLKAPASKEGHHLRISDLPEHVQRFLKVSDKRVGVLPEICPQLRFTAQHTNRGWRAADVAPMPRLWSRALVRIEADAAVKVPGITGGSYLWTEDDKEKGYYVAKVWPAMPTDVDASNRSGPSCIVQPIEPFGWNVPPIDNGDEIEKEADVFAPLINSTAASLTTAIEQKRLDPETIERAFGKIKKNSPFLSKEVHRRVVNHCLKSPAGANADTVRGLLVTGKVEEERGGALVLRVIVSMLDRLDGISIDLETDGQEIWELGLAQPPKDVATYYRASMDEGLQRVRDAAPGCWIGHNLQEWDRAALAKNGVEIDPQKVWDTLRIEALLSPTRRSLALNTSHKAGDDAVVAYQLFQSQIIRLLLRSRDTRPLPLDVLLEPLASQGNTLSELRKFIRDTKPFHAAIKEASHQQKEELLAATALPPVLQQIQAAVDANAAEAMVHIIYPRALQSLVEQVSRVNMVGSAGSLQEQYIREPTEAERTDPSDFGVQLAAFYRQACSKAGVQPTVGSLSPWARSYFQEHPTWIATTAQKTEPATRATTWAIPVEAYEQAALSPPEHLIVLAPDLVEASSYVRLAQYADDELSDFIARHHLWARFDGSGSYCKLSEAQAAELSASSNTPFTGQAIPWLQRTVHGRYALYAYSPDALGRIRRGKPDGCSWKEVTLDDVPVASVAAVKINRAGRSAAPHQQRLNPDTRQRAPYWAAQELLLAKVASQACKGAPIILLTRGDDEIEDLRAFFRRRGWYVPEGGTLRRRIELVEAGTSSRRLLILPRDQWHKLLSLEASVPIQLVVEALPIKRHQAFRRGELQREQLGALPGEGQMEASGEAEDEAAVPEPEEVEHDVAEDADESGERPYALQDGLFLIAPLLRWVAHAAALLSPEAPLLALDPRIEPIALPNEVNVRSLRIASYAKGEYEACLNEAKGYFPAPVKIEDITLPENWRESLEHVFLPPEASFHDYQEPYLEPIMRRERDVLVELPTGSGKSVLFQAPALYHGLRHGLLSIVITPLKALMVDQAHALYDKGFLSSVDYVSGDLPHIEIQDIYRRVASGDIAMLYLAPERFRSRSFMTALKKRLEIDGTFGYVVFDEAHCVSLWGLDFRPDFIRAMDFVNEDRKRGRAHPFPCVLLSATITEQIHEHLARTIVPFSRNDSKHSESHP